MSQDTQFEQGERVMVISVTECNYGDVALVVRFGTVRQIRTFKHDKDPRYKLDVSWKLESRANQDWQADMEEVNQKAGPYPEREVWECPEHIEAAFKLYRHALESADHTADQLCGMLRRWLDDGEQANLVD